MEDVASHAATIISSLPFGSPPGGGPGILADRSNVAAGFAMGGTDFSLDSVTLQLRFRQFALS
jgi:hypothetical protein